MPAQIVPSSKTKSKPSHKKIIRKNHKIARERTTKTPQDCDCLDENTMADLIQTAAPEPVPSSLMEIVQLLKSATRRFKISKDTYLVMLVMMKKIKFQIPIGWPKLIASALIMVATKVHQYRVPKFVDLLFWGQYKFSTTDLIRVEAQILEKFSFKVPVCFNFSSIKAIESMACELQSELLKPKSDFQ